VTEPTAVNRGLMLSMVFSFEVAYQV